MYLGAGDHPVEAVDGTLYYCDSGSVRLRRPDGTETNFIGTVFRDEFYYTPVMGPDGTVYVTGRKPDDDTGLLVALAPDLMLRWERRLPRRWDASPVVGSDGVVYAGSADGTVYATDAQGRPLWEFRAQGAVGPIVMGADGTLYFGCDRESELYALWTGSPGPVGSGKGEGIHEPGGKPVPSGGEPANDGIPAMPD
jgi:outer membrane protein assembly factor BamB